MDKTYHYIQVDRYTEIPADTKGDHFLEAINILGLDGWEMVIVKSGIILGTRFIFRRSMQDDLRAKWEYTEKIFRSGEDWQAVNNGKYLKREI